MTSFFSHSHIGKSAKFLSGFKKFNVLNTYNDGLCIDGRNKISLKRSMQHAMVLAPSGAGKTTSYIIPNLLRLKRGSAIVLDPSQEIYNLCSPALSKNFEIKMLNVTDLSKSGRWNPNGTLIQQVKILLGQLTVHPEEKRTDNSVRRILKLRFFK